ncbi:MAG: response regulator transcription factor [Chloroflexi bacterium]|nr:response regulator transcription factor [Chloroflexota bacterium]
MTTDPITVLIVDDHTVAREGLRAMLSADERVQVVGEAADGLEALRLTMELLPQVVLMDVRMPGIDGLEAARRLRAEHSSTAVIMMTSYDDNALVVDAVRSGASGYLVKDASQALLSHTIAAVASGGILIKEDLLRKAISSLTSPMRPSSTAPQAQPEAEDLTEREQAILILLSEGRTNKDIGDDLGLAETTIKKHVQTIIAKLRAADRTSAVVAGMRMGLIS